MLAFKFQPSGEREKERESWPVEALFLFPISLPLPPSSLHLFDSPPVRPPDARVLQERERRPAERAPPTPTTTDPTMSQQFGSMDAEKAIKKPLLPLKKMKKKPPSSSLYLLLSEAQVLSLKAALLFACLYGCSASSNLLLRYRQHGGPPCPCPCQCQEAEPGPASWFLRQRYVLTGADASLALLRGLLWCSALQSAAVRLALALLARGRSRRGLGVRAAACVALAAAAATHWIYLSLLGLFRVDSPGDFMLGVETACVVAAAVLNLVGFTAFVLGVGGGDEQGGRARARARAW